MATVKFSRDLCEALNKENCRHENLPQRAVIRDRLVDLDGDISSTGSGVLGLNLHRHWDPRFVTSAWYPHLMNGYQVSEIYIRYGKSRVEMDKEDQALGIPKMEYDAKEFGSFPAHIHISTGLAADTFFYQVVIGPRAWPDYNKMLAVLDDSTKGASLMTQFQSLVQLGYYMFFGNRELSISNGMDAKELSILLRGDFTHFAGSEWFGIRKDISVNDELCVCSEDLSLEIQRLYPSFEIIGRTSVRL